MKCIIVLLISVLAVNFSANAQNELKPANTEPQPETRIKQFWFVMLLQGNNRTQDSATAVKLQEGHMANISKLYYEGKLKVAGPFGDDGNWRGVFIFDVEKKEDVVQLLNADPAIAAGRLAYEIHPWYTAAVGSFADGKPVKADK
jgi:uncharacterized protein